MTLPTNSLVTVKTYQKGNTAYLLNLFAFVSTANKKYSNFDKITANLGSAVSFDKTPRYVTNDSLIATFQDSTQRQMTLTVDKAVNTAYAFSDEQFIFNVRDYMDRFGKAATYEIGSVIEADVASKILSSSYRFYGDGVTAITSYKQLATALAYFRNFGAAKDNIKGYISDMSAPAMVDTNLAQYTPQRNDKQALSWEIGNFSGCDWYQSNLLPVHNAGTVGNGASAAVQTLTVVSTNDPTGANITQITCTCDGSLSGDADAIKANDVGQFVDGVSGQTNVRFLTFVGHQQSSCPCQIRATANAGASTTTVVLSIDPALCSTSGSANRNINTNIVAGMKIKIMPSHRAGAIIGGNSLYLAMPQLPTQSPFVTANEVDPTSGVSIRMTYGSAFGKNERGMIHDCIWGAAIDSDQVSRILYPL